nr:4-oxalocrotonate decarboxylase [uncultured bacterium]BAH89751.1 4-oxalocrotonate decarboxylase [uncultured bacterium]BAH90577.1 4-oxalocrotonate decarboxylase [uncultured bacterium]
MTDITECARIVDDAARNAKEIPQFADSTPLTLDEAYAVQALSMQRRYARGERRVGIKMGFTSRAKILQMGLEDMIWGRLTDAMQVEEGETISLADYVHPRVEPEIAFILKAPLAGKVTAPQAMAAVGAIAPALEIIDSRYKDFKFNLGDVVADNSSSSGFVLGQPQSPGLDIANLGMVLSINGSPKEIGSSAAILGHPVRSMVAAARMLAEQGERLEAGDIVLAGGATAAVHLGTGDAVSLDVQNMATVAFSVGA